MDSRLRPEPGKLPDYNPIRLVGRGKELLMS